MKLALVLEWLRTFILYYKILPTTKNYISLLTHLRFLHISDVFICRISLIHVQSRKLIRAGKSLCIPQTQTCREMTEERKYGQEENKAYCP